VSSPDVVEALPFDARISEQIEARHDLETIRDAIAGLPEEQRVVLSLVALDGQSYQEAAETLAVPIGTIMSRLSRARGKLVEALDRKVQLGVKPTKGTSDDAT
jgi:RNA polymerase sigma-70 factor (ECF subfamily)